jgi:hypothetical protein
MSKIEIKRVIQVAQSAVTICSTGVKVAGSIVNGTIALSIEARKLYQSINKSTVDKIPTLQPALTIKQQILATQQKALTLGQEQGLPVQESLKVAGLATANLFVADQPMVVQQAMQAFSSNPTPATLETFTQQLAIEHQTLFANNLSLAVQQASLKVGFASIQTSTAANGILQIFASDDRGRTLVTEIDAALDGETMIATEVFGMSDPSCGDILDEFNEALAETGVYSSAPERKSTGGIGILKATEEFIRNRPTKSKTAPIAPARTAPTRRPVAKRPQNQQF